jgi:hypothetical protein
MVITRKKQRIHGISKFFSIKKATRIRHNKILRHYY